MESRIPCCFLVGLALAMSCGCERTTAPNLDADHGTALALREVLQEGAESTGGTAPVLSEPEGWATLAGRFQMTGTPPRMGPLNIDKDTAVCAPNGKQVLEQTVEVGSDGGIKNVLLYLVSSWPDGDPKWEHEMYVPDRAAEVIFDQKDCIFLSHVMGMRATQTLRILNSDPVLHNTNIQAGRGAIAFNGSVPSNGQTTYQPGGETDRPFPISCSVHPWMSAYMITRESPYFAVTDSEGRFEIANVPAAVELEFRVWQEKAGFLQKVSVDGSPAAWNQGRFSLTLATDERRDLNVTIDASVFK